MVFVSNLVANVLTKVCCLFFLCMQLDYIRGSCMRCKKKGVDPVEKCQPLTKVACLKLLFTEGDGTEIC